MRPFRIGSDKVPAYEAMRKAGMAIPEIAMVFEVSQTALLDFRRKYFPGEFEQKTLNCKACGKPFHPHRNNVKNVFCSKKCCTFYAEKINTVELVCPTCGKVFRRGRSAMYHAGPYYCSPTCAGRSMCGKQPGRLRIMSRKEAYEHMRKHNVDYSRDDVRVKKNVAVAVLPGYNQSLIGCTFEN